MLACVLELSSVFTIAPFFYDSIASPDYKPSDTRHRQLNESSDLDALAEWLSRFFFGDRYYIVPRQRTRLDLRSWTSSTASNAPGAHFIVMYLLRARGWAISLMRFSLPPPSSILPSELVNNGDERENRAISGAWKEKCKDMKNV